MFLFLLEQLRIAAHGGGPMGEGLDDTELVNLTYPTFGIGYYLILKV